MSLLPRLRSVLAELVAIDSTSVRPNAPVVDLCERVLVGSGFRCRRHAYRDDAGVEKVNLIAQRGEGPVELALVGHSDCVPFDPSWAEALTLTEKDGKLFGRGACDTKGFLAAALVAVGQVRNERPLAVLVTADEEVGCVGAKQLADAHAFTARRAIIGEPTGLAPVHAHKGYCLAEVEVLGKEGHSAYPEFGASAIYRAARFIARLEERARELVAEADPQFQPPHTTLNVGLISGGRAKNIIPGRCVFTVEWRPIPSQSSRRVFGLLERLVQELTRDDPAFAANLRILREDSGQATPAGAELVRFLADEANTSPRTVSFGTEAPHLAAMGAQAVVFGPGDIAVAHRTFEHVALADLERCEQALERAIARFCS